MSVAFDAQATTVTQTTTNTSPVTNTTLTIGSSGTLIIGVFSYGGNGTNAVPTAMTWNGVSMALITHTNEGDGLANLYMYALVSPTTGNHTLSCTFSLGSATVDICLDCFSFSGTDTTSEAICIPAANILTDVSTPVGTVYPDTAFSVTTASGDAVCAVMENRTAIYTTAASGTLLSNNNAGVDLKYNALYNLAVGATTSAQFGSGASGNPSSGIAVRIIQPAPPVQAPLMPQIWI